MRAARHHNKTDKLQQIDSTNMTWRKRNEKKGTKHYTINDKRADQQVQSHRASSSSNMAVHVDSSLGQNAVEGRQLAKYPIGLCPVSKREKHLSWVSTGKDVHLRSIGKFRNRKALETAVNPAILGIES